MTRTTRARTAKTAAPADKPAPAKKTTTAKKPPLKKPGVRTPRKTAAVKKPSIALALVAAPTTPDTELDRRTTDFITDAQIYANHAARTAGIPIHLIRDWRDHRNGTATRPLTDGSLLHYDHNTRTLTWQALCPMGATHIYELAGPSQASAARVHAKLCNQPHTDLTHLTPLTKVEFAELGVIHTPTWAAKDVIGETPTVSIPAPLGPKTRARFEQTQPLSQKEIEDGLAARTADTEPAKEHPDHA